jgi:hypothetical protein
MNRLFIQFSNFWGGHGKPGITENAYTELVDTGARLHTKSLPAARIKPPNPCQEPTTVSGLPMNVGPYTAHTVR